MKILGSLRRPYSRLLQEKQMGSVSSKCYVLQVACDSECCIRSVTYSANVEHVTVVSFGMRSTKYLQVLVTVVNMNESSGWPFNNIIVVEINIFSLLF